MKFMSCNDVCDFAVSSIRAIKHCRSCFVVADRIWWLFMFRDDIFMITRNINNFQQPTTIASCCTPKVKTFNQILWNLAIKINHEKLSQGSLRRRQICDPQRIHEQEKSSNKKIPSSLILNLINYCATSKICERSKGSTFNDAATGIELLWDHECRRLQT